ncbi:hypothetical protein J41TS2_39610 [Bacillus sonorensis]|nr:hypothetical protein J41TS2_39610 [Bacillus sonorensis]
MDISIDIALENIEIKLKSKNLSSNTFSAVIVLQDKTESNLKLTITTEDLVKLRNEINEFIFKTR